MKIPKVKINKKATYQEAHCLFCNEFAVKQADCGQASIRCCEVHIEQAKKYAVELYNDIAKGYKNE